jgi:hypothetical protein
MKKKYDYKLVPFGEYDDGEIRNLPICETSKKYRFNEETAQEHNRQYALNCVPRRLVRVKPRDLNNKT